MYDKERRKFGQNFLVDDSVCRGIADDADPVPQGTIIEIGPGAGALTELLCRAGKVVAVEIDPKWAEKLPRKVPTGSDLVVINQDALHADLSSWIVPGPTGILPVLCGNLPYNRASAILLLYLPRIRQFRHFTFMVQWEVAKRICANPGTRDYGALSVLVHNHARPSIRLKIGPDAFRPRPKVHSGTVLLLPREVPLCTDPWFPWFVRAAFRQKRKTLRNSLLHTFAVTEVDHALQVCAFPEGCRAEGIEPEGFVRLFEAFAEPIARLRSQVDPHEQEPSEEL